MTHGPLYFIVMQPKAAVGSPTLVVATEDFIIGPNFTYASLPAASYVEGRLKHPGVVRLELFSGGRTFGNWAMGSGAVVIENTDGALDSWRDYSFDACSFWQYRAPANYLPGYSPNLTPLDFDIQQIAGYTGQPEFSEAEVTIPIRDDTLVLDRPVQTRRYGGTNALPNGLDGSDDLKGKLLPICLGIVRNLTPICVNTVRQIYQLHDGLFRNSTGGTPWSVAPKDRGSALGAGVLRTLTEFQAASTDYSVSSVDTGLDQITLGASFAAGTGAPVHVWTSTGAVPGGVTQGAYYYARDLGGGVISLHPTAADASANTAKVDLTSAGTAPFYVSTNKTPFGLYDWCNDATGFFLRLGSKPVGALTVDARNNTQYGTDYSGNAVTLRDVLTEIFRRSTTSFSANGSPETYIAGITNSDVGIYLTEDTTFREVLQRFGLSFGAGMVQSYDSFGSPLHTLTPMLEPNGADTSIWEIGEEHLFSPLQVENTQDDWGEAVVWRVVYNYRRNWTVQNRVDMPGASETDIAFAETEWRTVTVEDASVKTMYPNAKELAVQSVLDDPATAATIAADLLARYKVRRRLYKLTVPMELGIRVSAFGTVQQLGLMADVRLTYTRFGLSAGAAMRVLGIQRNYDKDTIDLVLWR